MARSMPAHTLGAGHRMIAKPWAPSDFRHALRDFRHALGGYFRNAVRALPGDEGGGGGGAGLAAPMLGATEGAAGGFHL